MECLRPVEKKKIKMQVEAFRRRRDVLKLRENFDQETMSSDGQVSHMHLTLELIGYTYTRTPVKSLCADQSL